MKKHLLLILLFIIAAQTPAQKNTFIAGASGSLYFPVSLLSSRYKSTVGGEIYLGQSISESWTWTGNLEYFKFDKVNEGRLFITRSVSFYENGKSIEKAFNIPLSKLVMELEIAGLSAQATYKVYETNMIKANIGFGFGVYRWKNVRDAYNDSMFVDTSGTGGKKLAEVLKVPSNTQVDWSGGFNLGASIEVKLFEPVWLKLSGDYKTIIGELWQTLSLDMENVSTLQMFQIKLGVLARF
ncbi:MAG: hypothetical protein NTX22_11695 [Ignavibacteriales bacterium]|nr:hypothetical protein [Ignavibacteriales bacterium]